MKYIKRGIESVLTAGLLVLGIGLFQKAQAGGGSTDTITVSVTPGNVAYGVTISSPDGPTTGYNFQTVNLAAVTISTAAITVTNSGTISEFFGLSVSNLGTNNWTPVTSNPPGIDHFRLAAWFNATVPVSTTTFVDADALAANPAATSGTLFNQSGKTTPGNSPGPLWLNLSMPTSVSAPIAGSQSMVLSITGQAN
jgi:hypothetical protein